MWILSLFPGGSPIAATTAMASESSKAELKQKRRKAARALLSRDWEYEAAVDEAARGPKPYQRAQKRNRAF